ncbi:MAG: class I tRNA ligase family protein [Candidatus Niyogibacteria bacterium]|nr:class I tRNA ligase family protein [Candidatus Niyogibacteria bacterium]
MMEKSNDSPQSFAQIEEATLAYWEKNKIFEKTLKRTAKRPRFVFYEGPPYANGKPGIHHVEARAFKDILLRYKTMRGFFVARRAGWDTHGLPTEMEVEKKLGVRSKREIEEKVGIEKFVSEAKKSVWLYKNEWERMTKRMGYWLDLERPYITMSNEYIEGLWWVFSQIAQNGYLYRDYKVLPWCPRCGTPLSSHELAQGYKTVKDESVYVKFAVAKPTKESAAANASGAFRADAYFLVWTTTPWTLPGNVALAVDPKAHYVIVEKSGEFLILAKDRLAVLEGDYTIVKEETGDQLLGMTYEPLYKSPSLKVQISSYKVIKGDFVTTNDGTGIVHIAPAFGTDDQHAGRAAGLPTLQTTDESGKMKTKGYAWDNTYFKDADPMIVEDLERRKLLYKTETIEHEYPFCWRCRSALMYFARDSWFLKTTAVKKRMVDENAKIHWQPPFLKTGRFGEWLAENVDWAISRERYWGMPLPVWQCKRCKHETTVGTLEELDRRALPAATKIWLLRHGEAKHNAKKLVGPWSPAADAKDELTPKGKKQAEKAALRLAAGVDVIVSSPQKRAKQTVEIVLEAQGAAIPVEFRDGLREYSIGDLEGVKESKIEKLYSTKRKLEESFPNGESLRDVRARMMRELKAIAKEHEGKRVLVVSHGDPLWVMAAAVAGMGEEKYDSAWYPKTGEVKELALHNWPYNKDGELDLHRPYIDKIALRCEECEGEMQRIREVADVWFDSGAMPFAQNAGSLKQLPAGKVSVEMLEKVIPYPADYIAEGIDQTRGWFYTLLAVSALLELPAPYKNVLTLGLLLDAKGEKMSKSRGNIVEPALLLDRHGADAVRWYFYTVNQPWDEKMFRESDVGDAVKRFLNILWNSFLYWKTYAIRPKFKTVKPVLHPKMVVNQWLVARLSAAEQEMTQALDAYDVTRAARALEQFVTEDVSHWYIRRIRDPLRLGALQERAEISAVFGRTLLDIVRLAAPFVPFLGERMYREGGGKEASAHLESWPKARELREEEKKLLEAMDEARRIVSLALEARAKAGIKIRQPLAELKVKFKSEKIKNIEELAELITGEVNVKRIIFDANLKIDVELDTKITPELKEEGELRDTIRRIQEERKRANFRHNDKIILVVRADADGKAFFDRHADTLKREANLAEIVFDEKDAPTGRPHMRFEFTHA